MIVIPIIAGSPLGQFPAFLYFAITIKMTGLLEKESMIIYSAILTPITNLLDTKNYINNIHMDERTVKQKAKWTDRQTHTQTDRQENNSDRCHWQVN